ncbi:MAG: septum formation initiator family protein [Bacteroidaceae bacterium]|nr:septum formation initiator family protein [Bacteroidaceae bacterium]
MNDSIGKLINWIIKHKYLAVTIIFLLILIFFDENNIIKHIQLRRQESQLKADIEALQQEHDIIMHKLGELEKDAEVLEKVAREKYGMHLDNEEIFIIKD